MVTQTIELAGRKEGQFGVTYFSINVVPQPLDGVLPFSTASMLRSLSPANLTQLQSKSQFTTFYRLGPHAVWFGDLKEMPLTQGYRYRNSQSEALTLTVTGTPVDLARTPVPVVVGHNWLPYLRQTVEPFPQAMPTFPYATGDLIKHHRSGKVSQYYEDYGGWHGSLQVMEPGEMYLLTIAERAVPQTMATYEPL